MRNHTISASICALLLFISLTGCMLLPLEAVGMPVDVTAVAFAPEVACTDQFIAHELDHITTVAEEPVRMFDSNGAGLAVNDLDGDGDLDLVFANLRGNNAIFWNEGNFNFIKSELDHGQSRAVAMVDVDGNGLLDIVFTQRTGSLAYWHNAGERSFVQETLPGVQEYAYAMNWADLDGDGDLDLVTGSYDAGLEKELGSSFMLGNGGGVFYYENQEGTFVPTQLAAQAQALAIHLGDLNGDSLADILVGNDFAMQDQAWLASETGWQPMQPFATTTHSTMSFTAGDIDNDGHAELFATDMKPYANDEATQNAWRPVMAMIPEHHEAGDPQVMENVLQSAAADGRFENRAAAFDLDATGWSWSAKFGDLDNDGFLDLYVVNGMIAADLFAHLPGGELVERNQAFHNERGKRFVPMPAWQLDAETSGRGMSMADLDNDGDLDAVVNNLLAPAQIFENQLCGGMGLEVDLLWRESANPYAVGAELVLHTSAGTFTRQVQVASGYLSGDPTRVHIGIPADATLNHLDIRWPDGEVSRLPHPPANQLLQIRR